MDTADIKTEGQEASDGAPSIFKEHAMGGPSEESRTRKSEIQRLDAAHQMRPDAPQVWELDPADPDYLDLMQRAFMAWLQNKVGIHH